MKMKFLNLPYEEMLIEDKWDVTFGNGNCLAYSLSEIQSSTQIEFDNVTVDDMPCNYRYMNNNNNTVKITSSWNPLIMKFWKKFGFVERAGLRKKAFWIE